VRPCPLDQPHLAQLVVQQRLLGVHAQQLRKTQHGVQRRAQLVAHARQELGLGLAGALRGFRHHTSFLIQLVFGDVGNVATADLVPIGIQARDRIGCTPAPLATRVAHAKLAVQAHRTGHGSVSLLEEQGQVFRHHPVIQHPGRGHGLLWGRAKHLAYTFTDEIKVPAHVRASPKHIDHAWQVVGQGRE